MPCHGNEPRAAHCLPRAPHLHSAVGRGGRATPGPCEPSHLDKELDLGFLGHAGWWLLAEWWLWCECGCWSTAPPSPRSSPGCTDALPWGPGHHCCCQPESSKGGSWHHQLQRLLPGHPTCAACALQGFMPPASAATHPGRCQMLGTRLCCAQLPLPIAGSCTPTPGQYERPCQRLPSPVPPWAPSPGTPAHQ